MTARHAGAAWAMASVMLAQAAAPLPRALEQMVDTERAFAKLGAEKGPRDSFLVYFADEAIALDEAEPRPAKAAIRQWPAPRPGAQLLWEPRTGDIAASGDLGYLTGPVVRVAPDGSRSHACYMSVWKKQLEGAFRVVMDFGIQTPAAAAFAPGFTPGWTGPRARAKDSAADARASLELAEQSLASDARASLASAIARRVSGDTRVYRNGSMPMVGEVAIAAWARGQAPMTITVRQVEVAASGDLGYAWGSYATEPAGGNPPQKGHFVRVWGRGADATWRILIDVTQEVR
jgi:ketosteroid isomerase-like protein